MEVAMFGTKYLNKRHLAGFSNYKYNCIDNSPISVYISHPFWNWIVEFYPRWIAPNVLTFAGALIVMGCYALVSALDYNLDANSPTSPPGRNIPDWVWLLCAVGTFLAHLLDGTDGKQARRTGSSGPTGELFDHGFDSWSTVPFTITIFSIFGRGEYSIPPLALLSVLVAVQFVFIVSHWEKYNTGVLFLSWGYDASQYGLSIFYLITFFIGHQAFQRTLFGGLFNFAHLFCAAFFISCFLSLAMSIYNIHHAYAITKTGKQDSIFAALLPLLSPTLLFSAAFIWGRCSPAHVLDTDPRAFFWATGVVFSNIAVYMIIAQMSSTPVPPLNALLLAYLALVAAGLSGILAAYELLALRIAAILFTGVHLHYGICVIGQLCAHFRIQPFSLRYLQKRNK